jgi:hypothetical protein
VGCWWWLIVNLTVVICEGRGGTDARADSLRPDQTASGKSVHVLS